MGKKKYYLENPEMPFKQRCAWIDFYDAVYLEYHPLRKHLPWVGGKIKEAHGSREKEFWEELKRDLDIDWKRICDKAGRRWT